MAERATEVPWYVWVLVAVFLAVCLAGAAYMLDLHRPRRAVPRATARLPDWPRASGGRRSEPLFRGSSLLLLRCLMN